MVWPTILGSRYGLPLALEFGEIDAGTIVISKVGDTDNSEPYPKFVGKETFFGFDFGACGEYFHDGVVTDALEFWLPCVLNGDAATNRGETATYVGEPSVAYIVDGDFRIEKDCCHKSSGKLI